MAVRYSQIAQPNFKQADHGYAPIDTKKRLSLAQKIDDLIHHRRFGDCLAESYDDLEGAKWWAKFVSNDVQLPLKGTEHEYYASSFEIEAISKHSDSIAKLVADHYEGDRENMVVVEKGNGSRTAMVNKTLVQLNAFDVEGLSTRCYVPREYSKVYRDEAVDLFSKCRPEMPVFAQDVDFNKDDPPIEVFSGINIEGPRVVLEFGSSRSNIATSSKEDVPYDELHARFSHDRKVCRKGGIMIMASDCNQDRTSLEGSFSHFTHAEFSKNIFRRGLKEGVLTPEFHLDLIDYYPRWDPEKYLIKHTLVTKKSQNFKMYRKGRGYISASLAEGEEYIYSHSFRWPCDVLEKAALDNGFQTLGIFWDEYKRVAIFVFKAV